MCSSEGCLKAGDQRCVRRLRGLGWPFWTWTVLRFVWHLVRKEIVGETIVQTCEVLGVNVTVSRVFIFIMFLLNHF